MEDEVKDGQEATPAETAETAERETPEEQLEGATTPEDKQEEESQEGQEFDEEAYEFAMKKYGDQLEGAPKEAVALFGRREIDQSREASKVARRNKFLEREQERMMEELGEHRYSAEDSEDEEPERAEKTAPEPPANLQKLQSSLGRIDQRLQMLEVNYNNTRNAAASAHEHLVECKIMLRNATEALEKQDAQRAFANATARYNQLVSAEQEQHMKYMDLAEQKADLTERMDTEAKRQKTLEQEKRRQEKAQKVQAEKDWRTIVRTVNEMIDELDIQVDDESELLDEVEAKIMVRLRKGGPKQDLSKLTRDILTKQYGSTKKAKAEAKRKVAAVSRLRSSIPTPPAADSGTPKQPQDRAADLAAFEEESVNLWSRATRGTSRR